MLCAQSEDSAPTRVQVDVIEVGFHRLQATVSAAEDYEHAAAAHSEFVDGVLAAAFLDVRNLQVGFRVWAASCCGIGN